MKPKYFRSPLHCAELSNDGFLYVCDRGNNRIQVFKASEVGKPCQNPNGEAGKCGFVGEVHVSPADGRRNVWQPGFLSRSRTELPLRRGSHELHDL